MTVLEALAYAGLGAAGGLLGNAASVAVRAWRTRRDRKARVAALAIGAMSINEARGFSVVPTADGRLFMTPAEVSALERVVPANAVPKPPGIGPGGMVGPPGTVFDGSIGQFVPSKSDPASPEGDTRPFGVGPFGMVGPRGTVFDPATAQFVDAPPNGRPDLEDS